MESDIRKTAKETIKYLEGIKDLKFNHTKSKLHNKLVIISNLSDEEINLDNPKSLKYYNQIIDALKFVGKMELEKMKPN